MEKVVLALGGNALGNTPQEQLVAVKTAAESIVDLIEVAGNVVIVHGNGPQVGVINLGMDYAYKAEIGVPEFPLVECGSLSQGYIGYHLQQAIQNELLSRNIKKEVATVVTQVLVDGEDQAFKNPTKPIGNFYGKEESEKIAEEKGFTFVEDAGRGYRRVVASPKPVEIVEINAIKKMIDNDVIVIACGGGGIPVLKTEEGYKGVDAVIDKDLASSKLSADIGADALLVLTAVDKVCVNFNKPDQKAIDKMSLKEAYQYIEEGQFAPGSMLPKIEACIEFVGDDPKKQAIITSLESAQDAVKGLTGTVITRD